MPKPATVEDEVPSPVSPVDELPTLQSFSDPAPVATSPPAIKKESAIYPGSVNDLQGRFEELLINHPRFSYQRTASPSTTSSTCPYQRESTPLQHQEAPKSSCTSSAIPVTRATAAHDRWFAELAAVSEQRQNAVRNNTDIPAPQTVSSFSVYCNQCSQPIPDEHYHCSICDQGDFDLCQSCVDDGQLCFGEGHWMIKRFVKNGKVINSTTETIAPKPVASESRTTLVQPEEENDDLVATRTCNSCIQGKLEWYFDIYVN